MQIAHAQVTKDGKGMIFNFGFLMFFRIRGTRHRGCGTRSRALARGLSDSANVEKRESLFEVRGLGRGGISEAACLENCALSASTRRARRARPT